MQFRVDCNTKYELYIFAGISGGVVIVAPAVSVEFTCTGPDGEFPPTWLLNEKAAESEGDCYTSRLRRAGGLNATATLTINDNHTCNVFNIRCRIYRESKFLYLHNTTLTVQGYQYKTCTCKMI